jgi:hypothetical protein
MSLKMSASSFSTFRESSSLSPKRQAGEPSETPCQRLCPPRPCPSPPPSLAFTSLPSSKDPADGSLLSDSPLPFREGGAQIGCPTSGRDLQRDRGAILPQPSQMARCSQAILGPLFGVIQDMYLDDTHKGREVFSEVHSQKVARPACLTRRGLRRVSRSSGRRHRRSATERQSRFRGQDGGRVRGLRPP